jgi:hypothetical protein
MFYTGAQRNRHHTTPLYNGAGPGIENNMVPLQFSKDLMIRKCRRLWMPENDNAGNNFLSKTE